jgi:MFS family permease
MESLIIGRAFQGAAGGGLILLVHVCISDLFSLRQRSLLMGFTEGIWCIGQFTSLEAVGFVPADCNVSWGHWPGDRRRFCESCDLAMVLYVFNGFQ